MYANGSAAVRAARLGGGLSYLGAASAAVPVEGAWFFHDVWISHARRSALWQMRTPGAGQEPSRTGSIVVNPEVHEGCFSSAGGVRGHKKGPAGKTSAGPGRPNGS